MAGYLIRRILFALLTVFVAASLVFLLMRLIPGGPFDMEAIMSDEARKNLVRVYGLDLPIHEQYLRYLGAIARGDFGTSYKYRGMAVSQVIADRFPISATLALTSILAIAVFGVGLGMLAATRRNTWVDYGVGFLASLGYAVPNFVVALLLMLALAIELPLLPVAGWGRPANLVLPTIALSLPGICIIARLTRSSMINTLQEDYIRTAFAKGLRPGGVTIHHALQNSLIPVVTVLGVIFSHLLAGSIVIERVFAIPGVGNFFAASIKDSDYPIVMGLTLLYAVILVSMNLLVDLLYGLIDPRVSYE
jgi:oligopeptide transport system permease protein